MRTTLPTNRQNIGHIIYAEHIASAMELLASGESMRATEMLTGVNETHLIIAKEYGFSAYPLAPRQVSTLPAAALRQAFFSAAT